MIRRSPYRVAAPEALDPRERREGRGACRSEQYRDHADLWYAPTRDREALNAAMRVCVACPVRAECLEDALDRDEPWGIWGGLTKRQRRDLLRSRQAAA
ncbi:WhiB family transcriptional regulator [Streptomyces sp. NPDC102406]|uniref:WhiB family transcriptional regulator n=1 Tax=Streptomyces sp. NPDC102406 TaxID=3366171 RepID=UPI0038175650